MTLPRVVQHKLITAAQQNAVIDAVNKNTEDIANSVSPYTFTQAAAAATWSGTHGLSRYPRCLVIDSAGNELIADVQYPDENTFVITHGEPIAGSAHFL